MTDYFALLEQPRKPWLDAEQLKQKYHRLVRIIHPDRQSDKNDSNDPELATINEAYRILIDPKLRLQHLLKLEGVAISDDIPEELADLFMTIAPTLNKIDKQKAKEVEDMIGRVQEFSDRVLAEIRALDASWRENLAQIEKAYRAISYVARWLELLEERRFQLSTTL
jgi:curved DNA-binding protein CbpA